MDDSKNRQTAIWIAAAVSAPLAHFSGSGWLTAAAAWVLTLPLVLLPGNGWRELGRTASWLEFVWLAVVAGVLIRSSGAYWPSTGSWVIPLTLLTLAACTRLAAAPRAGAVVALMLAVLYFPVAVTGAAKLEWEWLKPRFDMPQAELLVALLMPALAGVWSARGDEWRSGLTALGFGLLTQGLVFVRVESPFYQVARTLPRLESVITVAMTLGWYAMAQFLLGTAAKLAENAGMEEWKASLIAALLAAASIMLDPGFLLLPITLTMWVLMPFLHRKRNVEKSENNA